MPIYSKSQIPAEVGRTKLEPEIAAWLPTGPVLGAHKPIHVQRREHEAFIDKVQPVIGRVEFIGIEGPHGTIPVRVYHPSKPGPADGGAMVLPIQYGESVGQIPSQLWLSLHSFCERHG
jgi:acetyl esterase